MHRTKTVEQQYLECDGCKYILGKDDPRITVSVPFDYPLDFLQDDRTEEFHFHAIKQRHDCFRYWAHNPEIMRDSLKARGLSEEQMDEFMSLMLYRSKSWEPGISRPEAASA